MCVCVCVFVLYTNPQFSTDLDQTWYGTSLEAGAEQGQVTDAPGRSAQQPWNPKKWMCPYLGNHWTDLDHNWYEASFGAGAEQGQDADALGQTTQQPWNARKMRVPIFRQLLDRFGPKLV